MNYQSNDEIRDKIIGLGESSITKSYYPQLKKRINEIEELNKTLEEKVEERTKELNKKNLALEKTIEELNKTQKTLIQSEKMAALGTLVSGIAHEMNTPLGISLTGMTHFLDTVETVNNLYANDNLSQQEFENFLKDSKELAQTISTNIRRASTLINDFKKISVEHHSIENRIFNLYEYIENITRALSNNLKDNQTISVEIPKNIKMYGSPSACYQIATNIIMNSLTHGLDDQNDGKVTIKAFEDKKNIVIIYEDNGIGIKKENLSKIFEPFFTTNRNFGGNGLGLNLVYNIVTTQLDGTIICESELNKGTKFIITLPKIL